MNIIGNEIMGEINPIEITRSDEVVIDNCQFYVCIYPDELDRLEMEGRLKLQERWERLDSIETVIKATLFSLLGGMLALLLVDFLIKCLR